MKNCQPCKTTSLPSAVLSQLRRPVAAGIIHQKDMHRLNACLPEQGGDALCNDSFFVSCRDYDCYRSWNFHGPSHRCERASDLPESAAGEQ